MSKQKVPKRSCTLETRDRSRESGAPKVVSDLSMLPRRNQADFVICRWKYFLACYGCSFIPALVYLFVSTKSKGKVYGPALVSTGHNSEKQMLTLH